MTLSVRESRDVEMIRSIIYNPIVARTALPPEEQLRLKTRGVDDMPLHHNNFYLLVYSDDDLAGCIRWCPFTNTTIEFHSYILPKYWGKGVPESLVKVAFQYFKDTTPFKKIITFVPSSCKHVQNALKRCEFTEEGKLENSILWKDKIEHLHIFGAYL